MFLFSLDVNNLQDLFVEQLRDLYDCEDQITESLPKMIDKASNPELKSTLNQHLDVTRSQMQRLEGIFRELNQKAEGRSCKGIKGILKEGEDLVSQGTTPGVVDASIIASAQQVEHYEIAGYGTVRTFAEQLGKQGFARVLEQILSEEKEADAMLSQIANTANIEAKRAA
jgi:ferritin-like metal-binding protein YciE